MDNNFILTPNCRTLLSFLYKNEETFVGKDLIDLVGIKGIYPVLRSLCDKGLVAKQTPITREFVGKDGKVTGLKVSTPEGEKIIPADKILLAVGSKPSGSVIASTDGIDADESGYVITSQKPYGMTAKKGVFAGGDVVHKPATVVLAMKEAKKVAQGISDYIEARHLLGV